MRGHAVLPIERLRVRTRGDPSLCTQCDLINRLILKTSHSIHHLFINPASTPLNGNEMKDYGMCSLIVLALFLLI